MREQFAVVATEYQHLLGGFGGDRYLQVGGPDRYVQ